MKNLVESIYKGRPRWGATRRKEIIEQQGGLCLHCNKELGADVSIHHAVSPWSERVKVASKLFPLWTNDVALQKKWIQALHDEKLGLDSDGKTLEALHSQCHKQVHKEWRKRIEQETENKERSR